MERKILKQLKSDYEELEIKPSADLWDQIDAALEKESESSLKSSFSPNWWKYAAVVLLLISFGTLIYYNRDFNTEKTDYIVKENLRKEVLKTEDNFEIIPQKENPIKETDPKIVKDVGQNLQENNFQNLKTKKEISQPQISESKESKIVIHQPENNIDKQENIENSNQPIISDAKKISYISADDLLLGRELDKSREKANMDTRKFGVIHIDKVIPKLGNVTVLGVTVYIDPK
ncbi:MAG: hypothetical protein K0R36_48 [Chryseobacterium sp.]|jgi:hypothetical protein|nr:hypothetical protein [Chryseobacterium sp.]